MGRLPGGGKRPAPGNEGGREDKDTKVSSLRRDILASMALTTGTKHVATHAVRNRIAELEESSRDVKDDKLFNKLFKDMTEPQMLKLQERFATAGRNVNLRYVAIAKSIFENQFAQMEECKRELDMMSKALTDAATLAMVMQYCNDSGTMNWDAFTKQMNDTTTKKSRAAGAAGAAEDEDDDEDDE